MVVGNDKFVSMTVGRFSHRVDAQVQCLLWNEATSLHSNDYCSMLNGLWPQYSQYFIGKYFNYYLLGKQYIHEYNIS